MAPSTNDDIASNANPTKTLRSRIFQAMTIPILALAMISVLCLVGARKYGSVENSFKVLNGDSILFEPQTIDLGDVRAGERRTVNVIVTNHSSSTVHILGAESSCSCAVMDGLPAEIPSSESRTLRLGISSPETPGFFSGTEDFHLDLEQSHPAQVSYVGRVVKFSGGAALGDAERN